MVDSESVVIDREVAAWVAGEPVVPAAGREREQALRDAGHEALQGTGAVALERELVLASVDDRLDPLADAAERAEARWFVAAVRTQQLAAAGGDELLELVAGEAFVGNDSLAWLKRSLEQLRSDLALGGVGGRELEGDRHPVWSTEQVQAEAPEVARM